MKNIKHPNIELNSDERKRLIKGDERKRLVIGDRSL